MNYKPEKDLRLEWLEDHFTSMRRSVTKVNLEFLAGTDIKAAASIMYGLCCETGGDVSAKFNGIDLTMESRR